MEQESELWHMRTRRAAGDDEEEGKAEKEEEGKAEDKDEDDGEWPWITITGALVGAAILVWAAKRLRVDETPHT